MFVADLSIYKKLSRNRSNTIADFISKLIENTEGKLLDFGAGNMFLAERLAVHFPDISIEGIDVIEDQNFDKSLLQKFNNLDFIVYDGKKIPYDDATFDYAVASAVMHHTPNPEFFLDDLKRVLKIGGCIILVEEMYHNVIDKIYISAEDLALNKLKRGVPVPLNFRAYHKYKSEFEKLNLKIAFEGYVRPSFPWKHHYVFKLVKE